MQQAIPVEVCECRSEGELTRTANCSRCPCPAVLLQSWEPPREQHSLPAELFPTSHHVPRAPLSTHSAFLLSRLAHGALLTPPYLLPPCLSLLPPPLHVQGAEIVKQSALDAVYVFVSPPSMPELEKRLRGRGTEKEASIQTRMTNARKEMAKTSVRGFFHKA